MRKILKIFTFIIVTLTALVLIFKPELVRTIIEKEDDLKLTIIIVAMIMPIFTGIMRFISDFNDDIGGKIMGALWAPLFLFYGCNVIGMLLESVTLYPYIVVPPLSVIVSYMICWYIMFRDFKNCNCYHESKECCVGECF